MTTGFSIFLVAAGATLRYALSYRLNGVDLQVLGSIIMATGCATLAVQAARALHASRRRARPIARTLPLFPRPSSWRPSEDDPTERFWPAAQSARDMPARAAGIRFEDNRPPPWQGPRSGVPQGWNEAADLAAPYHADDADTPEHQPEGAPRPLPAGERTARADSRPSWLPPRTTWQLDEAGWPDEVHPPAPGG